MTEPDFAMGTSLVAGTAREAEGRRPNSAPAASNNPNILPVGGRCMYARAVCALAYILRAEELLRTPYMRSSLRKPIVPVLYPMHPRSRIRSTLSCVCTSRLIIPRDDPPSSGGPGPFGPGQKG